MRPIVLALLAAACGSGAQTPALTSAAAFLHDHGDNPNPALFEKNAHPYGANMIIWGERASQWMWGTPLDHNPLLDQTGADCGVGQQGPVWFIPPIAGPRVFSGSRTCTLPPQRAIFLVVGVDINDYPCPDPSFQPAPGQSLYDFLIETDKLVMDSVNFLAVSLDGQEISDVLSYRFISDDLFYVKGDPSMQAVDACITGSPQPAIMDGFFLMFKPLGRGEHTIVVRGTNTFGADKTFTYNLTVE